MKLSSKAQRVCDVWMEFERKQDRFREFGAGDTEPDGVWQWYVARCVRAIAWGQDLPTVPTGVREWQLFPGGSGAARSLAGSCGKMRRALESCVKSRGAWREALRWLEGRIWRCDFDAGM